MTKAELVEAIAVETSLTKKATAQLLDVVFEYIAAAVKRDKRFSYPGFGTWTVRHRKTRTIRNPQTHALMDLPASSTIGFRPAKVQLGSLKIDPKMLKKLEAAEAAARRRRNALEEADREERKYAIDEVLG